MDKQDRKTAQAAYRRLEARPGIYALKAPDGQVWVGRATNLDTIANRVLFTLRHGSSPHREMQAAWNLAGPDGLLYEVLEELDAEELGLGLTRALKDRHVHWTEVLGAKRI